MKRVLLDLIYEKSGHVMPCEFLLYNQIVMDIGISGPFLSIHYPPRQAKSVGRMLNFIPRGPSFRTPQGKATLLETNIT